MIDNMKYIQAAALVKVQEKKMLNKSKINRMIDANTITDVFKILSETEYSKSMIDIENEENFDKILSNELEKVYKFSNEIIKDDKEVIEILFLKYEFQKLKNQLKYEVKNAKKEEINEKYSNEYNLALKEYEKTNDIQMSVILLDKLYFKKLYELCKKVDIKILNDYYNITLNTYNILTFLRLKNQNRSYKYASYCLIDNEELLKLYELNNNYISSLEKMFDNKKMWQNYAKNLKISTIEKELENSIVDLIKEYKNINYGIEPIITYIIAKEYEIKAIRLLMIAKINKIPSEIIKERMRDIYV